MEADQEVLTIRIPNEIAQLPDGTIVVKSHRLVSHRSDRGDDVQMMPDEYAAFCDLMLDKTIRWTAENADTAKRINRDADLYHWWRGFIEGPLAQVPIGDEQFRKSRAGLIHHTFMNSIRKAANLSPADFKALSLAEVFAVISDIQCREHNEENRLRQQASGRKPDADRTQGKNSGKNHRPWDANCERMAKAYIRQCVKDGQEIARAPFITAELRKNGSLYPNAKAASTIDRAFRENEERWKPALIDALKNRETTGRKK